MVHAAQKCLNRQYYKLPSGAFNIFKSMFMFLKTALQTIKQYITDLYLINLRVSRHTLRSSEFLPRPGQISHKSYLSTHIKETTPGDFSRVTNLCVKML